MRDCLSPSGSSGHPRLNAAANDRSGIWMRWRPRRVLITAGQQRSATVWAGAIWCEMRDCAGRQEQWEQRSEDYEAAETTTLGRVCGK